MKRLISLLAGLLLAQCSYAISVDDITHRLNTAFTGSYEQAVTHYQQAHFYYPVIVQDLLSMTLILPDNRSERFHMDKGDYSLLAEISHPPLVIYNILSENDWTVTDAAVQQLKTYDALLETSQSQYAQAAIPAQYRYRVDQIFGKTREYIQTLMTTKRCSERSFEVYDHSLSKYIAENLHDGALTQLKQFKTQLQQWQRFYPELDWKNLRVVVIGPHDPRQGYVLKQFFRWLLNEPRFESHVIYTEYPEIAAVYKDFDHTKQLALQTIVNTDYQLGMSQAVYSNPAALQRDVMAHAGKNILARWGRSNWPAPQ